MKRSEPNFLSIKENSCFQLDNGQFIVKVGLMNNLNYLIDFFERTTKPTTKKEDDERWLF